VPEPGPFADSGLTRDCFLDGRLTVLQPQDGYRAAMDPVLLAAAVPARPGDAVLDLGCGVGVASLCLGWRVPGLLLTGVEADLSRMPADLRARSFDQVIANPPYFPAGCGTAARDASRESAQREATPLAMWIDVGLRRLRPGGWLTVIQAADRLGEILTAVGTRGAIRILPIAPREGRPAGRVIVQVRKADRGPLRLLAPLVLHAGPSHLRDGDDHSAIATAILRDGAALNLDD
jgi:tRNA1Val (adenine37-N6)-methyltransferase